MPEKLDLISLHRFSNYPVVGLNNASLRLPVA